MDPFSDELSLIDCGLKDLKGLVITSQLRILNLHSNSIERIENLNQAHSLVSLDLSSNRIQAIEGLSSLSCLRILNLSCNLIERVSNLSGLRSLVHINLSYNYITSLDGFVDLHGAEYQLKHVQLHGNKLSSFDDVINCLSGCVNLSSITLKAGSSAGENPCCSRPGYATQMFAALTQVTSIDGLDCSGHPVSHVDSCDICELEPFMGLCSSFGQTQKTLVATPKIDAALNAYKYNKVHYDSDSTLRSSSAAKSDEVDNYAERLKVLEQQVTDMLKSRTTTQSFNESLTDVGRSDTSAARSDTDDIRGSDATSVEQTARRMKAGTKRITVNRKSSPSAASRKTDGSKYGQTGKNGSESDRRMRDDLRSTYLELVRELEMERERRFAAEEASKRLAQQLELAIQKNAEDNKTQQKMVQMVKQLKQILATEKASRERAQAEAELMQEKVDEFQDIISEKNKSIEEAHAIVNKVQETAAAVEQDRLCQITDLSQKIQQSQLKLSATERELELVKGEAEHVKTKLQQLHAFVSDREQAHQKEMERRHPLNSKEVDDLIAKSLAKAERDRLRDEHVQCKKYNDLEKKYSELEDEFRAALHIESERFKELQTAFERTSAEAAANRAALEVARQRDDKSTAAISELTALVQEQKGRIAELVRTKTEQTAKFRERVQQLETHLDEAQRRLAQLTQLKQECAKMKAALHAQESLVAGLREERKLWSEELAKQGASLSQDRGRLEARIEALQNELASARKQSEQNADALRIKAKLIDDQTETVRHLKEGIVERDEQIRQTRSELLTIQHELEDQLSAELAENRSLSEKVDREQSRNKELKGLVSQLQSQLVEEKRAHASLQERWLQKTDAVAAIEQQVLQAKSTWETNEKKLTEERNNAIEAAKVANSKLREMDDAFRQQLDMVETGHRAVLADLTASKQAEVDAAVRRTAEVEQEMRALLLETDAARQNMEARIRKLTGVFAELQQDMVR